MTAKPHSGSPKPSQATIVNAQSAAPHLVPLLHAGFVLTGIANTMLGPLLPFLSWRLRLSDVQAGNIFVAQFIGSMVGVTGSSFLMSRRGSRFAVVLGLLMMALGSAALALTGWSTGIVPLFTLGIGLGLTIPTTNLLISEMYPEKRAAALNLINLSWGLGAVTCPFIIAALQQSNRGLQIVYGLAVLLLLLAAMLMQIKPPVAHNAGNELLRPIRVKMWSSRYVPILGAIFFLYVGTEASIGGWIASYAQRTMPPGTAWVLTPSYFWASLLFGRSVAPILLRHVAEALLSRIGLITALLGIISSLAARDSIELGVSTCLAGLGLSSVFPIAIAALSHKFGEMASRIAGLMFNLAGLGGATLPWLVGFTSNRTSSLKLGLWVPLLGCVTMLVLHLLLERKTPPNVQSSNPPLG
jgi:FHS family glucose/mannose:H+ symporter-like MFS transporter